MANKRVHIIGGGTVFHLRNHLALCSPAYGTTAKQIAELFGLGRGRSIAPYLDAELHLTKMAGGDKLETNKDIEDLIAQLVADPATKIVILNAAMCDYEGQIGDKEPNKYGERLHSRIDKEVHIDLTPAQKIVKNIREKRKDIFAVAFKTTCGATPEQQYICGLNLLKEASVNLVLANDTVTRLNMVITPEEARYHETTDRGAAIRGLVEMAVLRSQLTFTHSTVVDGQPVPWDHPLIPDTLRDVVDYCIQKGAYKPFRGATVGHFAVKLTDNTFLTSIRKTNFNDLDKNGLVRIVTDGPDSVIAYGAKPSVGGQSQRIVFHDHQEYDCIVHFHCPKKPESTVPEVSQREYECGSHQCGENTSKGLQKFGNLSAVYLQEHGPNIVFNSKTTTAKEVIDFIDANFDLNEKTGGYVSLGQILRTPDHLDVLRDITRRQ